MNGPRCCNAYRSEVNVLRGAMHTAARKASRYGHAKPRYIEEVNQARAAYIKAKNTLLEHEAVCSEAAVTR